MKATSLFLAAAFALGTTAAFAQTTPGTTTSGTMNQTPSTTGTTGTMNNGTMGTGTMNNGTTNSGTMGNGDAMRSDRATMRSNRRMNKGSKMKSKTNSDGAMKSTM
jgi:hypothetical protein